MQVLCCSSCCKNKAATLLHSVAYSVSSVITAGIENTETNRRDWRELLYTAPDLGKYISGAIMFEETLYQSCADGKPFVDVLRDQGIMPGIKVDGGLEVSSVRLS